MIVVVWVCPSFGCGNYYAASSAGDLREKVNEGAHGGESFSRARCPDCQQRGREVMRRPIRFEDGLDQMRNADLDARMAARDEATT